MAKTKKSHKLKRKRGKKFVYRGDNPGEESKAEAQPNPFEEHSKSKRARRDLEKR